MQSPRHHMMATNLTAEEVANLKTNQDLKIPAGHKLTDLHDGNTRITGWPELFPARYEGFPDLVVSQAVQDAIEKGGVKMHHTDLDILHMYNWPVGRFEDFDIDVSKLYPNPYTLFNKPASLFSVGISQHQLSTVKEMKQAREDLKNQVNLTEFTNWLENLLGDDLEEYLNLRDSKQSLTGVSVLLIMRYKESRRLTTEIMKNVKLDTIENIDPSEYLGLTINKVLEKIDVLETALSAKISLFTTKYPGIFEIFDMYNTLVKPRAVPIFGNQQGLSRGEMLIAGGVSPNVPMGSGRHFLDNGQEVFITLERSDSMTPEETEELMQRARQTVLSSKHLTVPGLNNTMVDQILSLAETAHVDIPETREERKHRLVMTSGISGAIVEPQPKPKFNKATHQQLMEDTKTVEKVKNASLSGAHRNWMTDQYRDQVVFSENIPRVTEGVNKSLTGICRDAHRAVLSLIANSENPNKGNPHVEVIDSFSAYKPEPINIREKLNLLPGYVHSDEQLTEDIKEGNVILTTGSNTTDWLACTPEGELIHKDLDPEDYIKIRQVMQEMNELLEKEFKDKEKVLLENSKLPPNMTLEVEEGATPYEWRTTVCINGNAIGHHYQFSRPETDIK